MANKAVKAKKKQPEKKGYIPWLQADREARAAYESGKREGKKEAQAAMREALGIDGTWIFDQDY